MFPSWPCCFLHTALRSTLVLPNPKPFLRMVDDIAEAIVQCPARRIENGATIQLIKEPTTFGMKMVYSHYIQPSWLLYDCSALFREHPSRTCNKQQALLVVPCRGPPHRSDMLPSNIQLRFFDLSGRSAQRLSASLCCFLNALKARTSGSAAFGLVETTKS